MYELCLACRHQVSNGEHLCVLTEFLSERLCDYHNLHWNSL